MVNDDEFVRLAKMADQELVAISNAVAELLERRATEHLVRAQLETLRNAGESYPDLCIRNPGAVIEILRRLT